MMKKLFSVLTSALIVNIALAQCAASFTPSQNPLCQGDSVIFTDLSSGATGVVTYSWNFGSGAVPATSTLQNPPPVTYTTSGVKTVTLTYSGTGGGGCSDVATQAITVNVAPTASFVSNAPVCENTAVNFTNTGTTGPGVTFTWDFGSGATPATSTAENPTGVMYSTSGTKIITFTVNNGSCIAVDTMSITIESTPMASFTSNAPQCEGSAVNFNNTGTIVGVTYAWNFGVGAVPAISTVQNPAGVIYGSPGIKTVALTTTDATTGCNVTTTENIVINPTPVANFTSSAPKCAGSAVNFTNTGTAVGVTYSWSFGAGATPATSTAQSPTGIIYSTSGSKTVTLTTTNPVTGCYATVTKTITINSDPVASFSSTAPQCTGAGVNFMNTGTTGAGITYSWNFGPGAVPATSTAQNPTGVVYSTSGIKTITFVVTNTASGCSATITQTININPSPVATFTSTAPQCAGSAVDFTNTGSSGAGVTYNWNFGSDATPTSSTAQNPSGIVFSNPGMHLITFSVDNGTCTSVDTMSININSNPVASFVSNAPQCTGSSVNFTNTGSAGAGITYNWNFGAGATPATSTAQNPSGIVYSVSGGATVSLTVTNTATGCSSTTIQTIYINQAPTATFVSNAPVCEGNAVNFTNTGTTGAGVTYNWNFGLNANPSSSIAQNPMGIVYSSPGNKLVTFTVTNGSCTTIDTMTIVVDTTPVANFISNAPRCIGDSVSFSSTGTNTNVTYLWNFGPNATPMTSIAQNPTGIVFSTSGAQTVTLSVSSITTGCTGTVTQSININKPPVATFTSNTPQCAGSSVNFTNTGASGVGISYNWDFGQGSIPNVSNAENPSGITYSSGGTKTVTFTVNDGLCTSVDTMDIVIDSIPVAEAGPDTTICANDSVQIGVTPMAGYKYTWFPPSVVSNDTIANPYAKPRAGITLYIVTVTSPAGCTSIDTATVTMLDPLIADAGNPVAICAGDSTMIGGPYIAGQNYSWAMSAGLSDTAVAQPYAKPAITTTYTLTVTGHGCPQDTGTVTVTVHPLPVSIPWQRDTIGEGTSVQLSVSGGIQYMWAPEVALDNPGIYNPIANPDTSITYIVTVTDVYGCMNTDTVSVVVNPNELWAPSAFTPNGDGKDDIFYIHGEGITNFSMGVYNRWGEQIFRSEDINKGWDGTRQITGEQMPNGAYIYYAKGTDAQGNAVNMKGMINLIR